ncbi:uncharacterized protein GGS25DRAFT_469912, partial [Hypoxylon fragiforme]|uniref:uncharacterized protein n=1 Tax=Hypoxylon fragiforme TaxID=63214 RepID=UPI0020C72683
KRGNVPLHPVDLLSRKRKIYEKVHQTQTPLLRLSSSSSSSPPPFFFLVPSRLSISRPFSGSISLYIPPYLVKLLSYHQYQYPTNSWTRQSALKQAGDRPCFPPLIPTKVVYIPHHIYTAHRIFFFFSTFPPFFFVLFVQCYLSTHPLIKDI